MLIAQSSSTLCDPMDCSPSGSSLYGILQVRMLEWVAIPFSRGSCWPRDGTLVSCIAGRFFTIWGTRKAQKYSEGGTKYTLSPLLLNTQVEISLTIEWQFCKEIFDNGLWEKKVFLNTIRVLGWVWKLNWQDRLTHFIKFLHGPESLHKGMKAWEVTSAGSFFSF